MRRPKPGSSASTLYLFARFTARALDKKGYADIYQIVHNANQALLQADRKQQDTTILVEEAYCDRYFAGLEIDDRVRLTKRQIDARGPRAFKEAPSIEIFPDGIKGYVEVTKEERRIAVTLLVQRLSTFLTEEDLVRKEAVPELESLL